MVDPRERDPRFPDRPTHPDFIALSEIVQEHDHRSEVRGESPFEIVGVDQDSLMYFMRNRIAIFEQRLGTGLPVSSLMAVYMDAFALGRAFGEREDDQ